MTRDSIKPFLPGQPRLSQAQKEILWAPYRTLEERLGVTGTGLKFIKMMLIRDLNSHDRFEQDFRVNPRAPGGTIEVQGALVLGDIPPPSTSARWKECLNQYIERLYAAVCDSWEKVGRKESAEFYRGVMDCVLRMRIKERRQDFFGLKEDVDNWPRDGWDWKRDEFLSDIARCADEVQTDFLTMTEVEVLRLEALEVGATVEAPNPAVCLDKKRTQSK